MITRRDAASAYYRGKRFLVTGGLGFIGSTLSLRLSALGADVTIMDSLIPGYGGNPYNVKGFEQSLRINIADVRDRPAVNWLVNDQDGLFNLAGTLSHTDSMRDPFTDLEINGVAQLCILEACRTNNPGIKIVFAGTRGQYGRATYLPVDEDHPMRPIDINGINNVAAESYHLLYHSAYGIRSTSLRLTNTFGPRHQMRHARQGVLNWFIRQLLDGDTVRVFGDGAQKRDTNYVDDVVDGLLLAMMTPATDGHVYNLSGDAVSLTEFVEHAIAVVGGGSYEVVPYPPDVKLVEVGDYVATSARFHVATGWAPAVSIDEGLARTVSYYRANRDAYWP